MGYYLSLPILILLVALQSSLLPGIRLLSGQPDFIFLVVIIRAVHAPLEESLFWAFLGGILLDLLSAIPIGTSTIGMILIIFAMHAIRTQVFRVNLLLLFIFILTGTILQHLIAFVVAQSIGIGGTAGDVLQYVTLPTLFYNFIFMIPMYIIMWILHYFADPSGIR